MKWYFGTCLEVYDTEPFFEGNEYHVKTQDFEKFIKIVATDRYGNQMERRFFLSHLPVLYIETENHQPIESKTIDVNAHLIIQGNSKFTEQYDGGITIHGRGHSSWNFPSQKPYKIKLDKKTDLFGFGANKHWVLLSNFRDSSLERNNIGSEIAKDSGFIGMDMLQVTVILNGRCEGVYQFSEHIRVGEGRIEIFNWEDESEARGHSSKDLSWIDDDPSIDTSGGYLFEMDYEYDETSKFLTHNGMRTNVTRPEYASTS